jgi:tripartite-type tricarboxylate transporter receptor subunit TctC
MPGKPTVVVQYMPGAGGRLAANYLYNAAAKDGSVIGILFYNTALSYRLRPQGASVDPRKFNWLGSHSPTYSLAYIWERAPATSLAQMKGIEVFFAASGKTSPTGMLPHVMNTLLGTRIKVVEGYQGTADSIKAGEAGEVHGGVTEWDALTSAYGEKIRSGQFRPILQLGLKRHPDLAQVPLLIELAANEESRRIAEFMGAISEVGHTYAAPPGVPAERVAALRDGIAATLSDRQAVAAAEKIGIPIQRVPAEEVARMTEVVMAASEALVAKAAAAAGLE